MSTCLFRTACFGVFLSAAAFGLQSSARAATLLDTYYGGLDYYDPGNMANTTPQSAQVIGDPSIFEITSADVSLNPAGEGTLTVTINTNYAGMTGTDNTSYGSLFIGSASTWNTDHVGQSAPYATDQYHPGEWSYAFNMTGTTSTSSTGSRGTGSLYSIGSTQTPNYYPGYGVVSSYTTSTGNVVMSNVGGNPVSYPIDPNSGWWFRQGQAVAFDPSSGPSGTGSWSIVNTGSNEGSITYVINDYDLLGYGNNPIAISWAMTCANDIIQGTVSTTPLPATLPLFASGIGLLGFFGLRRKKQLTALPAAIAA